MSKSFFHDFDNSLKYSQFASFNSSLTYVSHDMLVTYHSVADVNNALVDDGLVDKEKIGGSNYFWSFPGKKDRELQIAHENTLSEIEKAKERVAESQSKLADAKRGREDDDGERAKKLARKVELEKEKIVKTAELEKLKENDPQALADLEKEVKFVKEAAHRWTDNIFQVRPCHWIEKSLTNSLSGYLLTSSSSTLIF